MIHFAINRSLVAGPLKPTRPQHVDHEICLAGGEQKTRNKMPAVFPTFSVFRYCGKYICVTLSEEADDPVLVLITN